MKRIAFCLAVLTCICLLFGCGAPEKAEQEVKYKVDYCGQKMCYQGAEDSYPAGEQVKVYYNLVATDTDYTFLLDGEEINATYTDEKGFCISFEMPDHDVQLECQKKNSMVYQPMDTLTFSSFDGGGPDYTVRLDDPSLVSYEKTVEYGNPNHAELDGAAYDVIFTFEGKKAGVTHMTLEERSPIADNRDMEYTVEVDETLSVTITKESERWIDEEAEE